MGEYADKLANGEEDVIEILGSVPGPMCPKIDEWVGKPRNGGWGGRFSRTSLGRRRDYDNDEDGMDGLYSDATAIADERDTAIDGLEECRRACEALRAALESAVAAYREQRDLCIAERDDRAAS